MQSAIAWPANGAAVQSYPVMSSLSSTSASAAGGGGKTRVATRVVPNVRGFAYRSARRRARVGAAPRRRARAASGNGAAISRVDVSCDGGKTWHVATLEPLV